jgi:hypothetical protein
LHVGQLIRSGCLMAMWSTVLFARLRPAPATGPTTTAAPRQPLPLAPRQTPKVAPTKAALRAPSAPHPEERNAAPRQRTQADAEPVTHITMGDCQGLGWVDDPSHGQKNVRRILDGECCRPISARDHACELLAWLRAHPLLVDQLVPATDLAVFYRGYCRSVNLKELPWQSVAAQLNHLTGGRRLYRRVEGRKLRVYHIAPHDECHAPDALSH